MILWQPVFDDSFSCASRLQLAVEFNHHLQCNVQLFFFIQFQSPHERERKINLFSQWPCLTHFFINDYGNVTFLDVLWVYCTLSTLYLSSILVNRLLHHEVNTASEVQVSCLRTQHNYWFRQCFNLNPFVIPALKTLYWYIRPRHLTILFIEKLLIPYQELFSFECRKTQTNHKGHRQYSAPIKTWSNYFELTQCAGNRVRVSQN